MRSPTSIPWSPIRCRRFGTRWRPEFVQCIGRLNNQFVMILDVGRIFASAEPLLTPEIQGLGGKNAPIN